MSDGTLIEGNSITNYLSGGISIYDNSTNGLVQDNDVFKNFGDGIVVQDTAGSGTQVLRNSVRGNNLDGIELNRNAVQVGDNTAINNDGWGILSTAVVVDAGGEYRGRERCRAVQRWDNLRHTTVNPDVSRLAARERPFASLD